jgi:hypothetical protein
MPGETSRTAAWDRKRTATVFDPSFEAVCLFSLLGLVISLLFIDHIGPEFDVGSTPTSVAGR